MEFLQIPISVLCELKRLFLKITSKIKPLERTCTEIRVRTYLCSCGLLCLLRGLREARMVGPRMTLTGRGHSPHPATPTSHPGPTSISETTSLLCVFSPLCVLIFLYTPRALSLAEVCCVASLCGVEDDYWGILRGCHHNIHRRQSYSKIALDFQNQQSSVVKCSGETCILAT